MKRKWNLAGHNAVAIDVVGLQCTFFSGRLLARCMTPKPEATGVLPILLARTSGRLQSCLPLIIVHDICDGRLTTTCRPGRLQGNHFERATLFALRI